jgi:hypothetical protein
MSDKRELLRHSVATLAYRAARALNDAPESFAGFDGAGRRPEQILAHMGDLFEWALSMAVGKPAWHNSKPLAWEAEKARFFAALGAFDALLASGQPLHAPEERLFQAPVADALTHVGQLAMLRRLAGCAARSENFYVAAIDTGRVGAEQAEAIKPF